MTTSDLRELARRYSVQLTYHDAAGKKRSASPEALEAVLRSRAVPSSDRWIEPVTVVWGKARARMSVRLPESTSIEWAVELEDGTLRDGCTTVRDGALRLSDPLPFGYHTLRTTAGGRTGETLIIVAPMKAPAPRDRSWGLFIPLYAVREAADLGDLRRYREWANELGGGVVATLPILASADDEPSPYSPVSRLFWNEMYLDCRQVPEFRPEDEAFLNSHEAKRKLIARLAERFVPDREFEEFADHARDYAAFRAGGGSTRYHLYAQYRMAQQMRSTADDAGRRGIGLYLDFPLGVNADGYDVRKYPHVFAKGVATGAPPDLFFTRGQNWGFPPFHPDGVREDRYRYFRDCIRHHVSHAAILRLDHVMALHRLYWIPQGAEASDGVYVHYHHEEFYAVVVLEASRHGCTIVGEDLGTVPQYVPRTMKKHGLRRMFVVQYELKPDEEAPMGIPDAESVASVNTHDMPTFAGFWSGKDIAERVARGLLDEEGAARESQNREKMRHALMRFLTARSLLEKPTSDTKVVLQALLAFLGGSPAEIVLVNLEDLWLETEPQNVPGMPERSWKGRFRFSLAQARANEEIVNILQNLNRSRRGADGNET